MTDAHQLQAAELSYSVAGRAGRLLEPVLQPLGFDWRIGTAMIGAFAAKEVFVAQLGIVFAVGDVRAGSVKRVAAAVGEGSVVVSQIFAALAPR